MEPVLGCFHGLLNEVINLPGVSFLLRTGVALSAREVCTNTPLEGETITNDIEYEQT